MAAHSAVRAADADAPSPSGSHVAMTRGEIAEMLAFIEDIAGGDCDRYTKHLSAKPCGQCQPCRARTLLSRVNGTD